VGPDMAILGSPRRLVWPLRFRPGLENSLLEVGTP
jgi:hypothetical protein